MPLKIPKPPIEADTDLIIEVDAIPDWDFGGKYEKKIREINEPTNESQELKSDRNFIIETASIVKELGFKLLTKNELIFEITKEWIRDIQSVPEEISHTI